MVALIIDFVQCTVKRKRKNMSGNKIDKIDCKDCRSFDVCQYKDLLMKNNFDLQINHPFLRIICTKFIPKQSKISKDRQEEIRQWRISNPNGIKIDCERETGISRPTVLKYWDGDEKGEE